MIRDVIVGQGVIAPEREGRAVQQQNQGMTRPVKPFMGYRMLVSSWRLPA